MLVSYINEYEEQIFKGDTQFIPRKGDTVQLEDEYYEVKDVIWDLSTSVISVVLAVPKIRKIESAPNDVSGRLNEMQRAIIDLNKRQGDSEKKARTLNEQLVSVRTKINAIPKPKPQQDNR